ncbi:1-aminocyclopropane-1-carboxylate deaminase [Francisella philomiragia]|uniref:1-aminocyclopropane-1-carboxylate deaminase n=1 Tax=Francisella philomiragia subsp. philomiragia (strain ATCC 25017 / CCUG 19701 / FSC 153 / O\|nr:1-aminocyclopropane-1-carboxylate deaminase [Francisella philomiragia]AJI48140.1 pyridoxal-phosphate dependent enzyme family protein [Francisella philomiragia]AJI49645.1 pyridoxal-phosphate dependent enzyme family protein [Francisella philomiragia]MBK2020204.1 1-aminocyclopropane-1-carboxylate deaminase [Francisella philomiragia]MBK2031294.1 1-aminocyclopropane-1-carboxylate deaminase [Francisella philomiragia]MBK2264118.1 1-aminocyclopropane-1-carboxylate deaminase [Francisella philomiragi
MVSLFQEISFENKDFIVMRDDLNHPIFSGNKARKLAYLLKNPDKYSRIKTIVSFGGNQSNFMLALSQLAKIKGWDFHYWIKPLSKFLKNAKNGNLKIALENGMQLFETTSSLNLESIKTNYNIGNSLYFFDQGGRNAFAEEGIADCANEIKKYCLENDIDNYSVVVASGTGTTALYLEKYLPNKVYTIACVGDNQYLKKQFNDIDNGLKHPKILNLNFKTHFGQLDIQNYAIYQKLLEQTEIEFELLYDPIAWRALLNEHHKLTKPIIYIHCGGTSGNETMIARYTRLTR